ncbi:type III-B CRISPR module RAMP protein Cmr4 [Sulfolobales archaeon HS-7]|nr:type III-B CRISPR module RAMP protein Cmr4 [Sulfolobales archaeon HS-7]
MSVPKEKVDVILIYAITPLHVGAGRSGGAVDLPVQRDPFNYPVVYASSFKGALKSFCATLYNSPLEDGRINCEKAGICCCLFGPEKGDETGSGVISVTDLIPLLVPIPSNTHGYIYGTSRYLISRVTDLLELTSNESLRSAIKKFYGNSSGEVDVAGLKKPLIKIENPTMFTGLGKLSEKINDGITVLEDDEGSEILERAYIRMTRNKINLSTKTTNEGGLWTEEYLPQGTIMFGLLVPSLPKVNKYCRNHEEICSDNCFANQYKEFLKMATGSESGNSFYMNLGGKETIGRGVIKVSLLRE